jgi:PITH domain
MDLSSFIHKAGCECLNEADDHVLADALTSKGGFLESDCDEQVTLFLQLLFVNNKTVQIFQCLSLCIAGCHLTVGGY